MGIENLKMKVKKSYRVGFTICASRSVVCPFVSLLNCIDRACAYIALVLHHSTVKIAHINELSAA